MAFNTGSRMMATDRGPQYNNNANAICLTMKQLQFQCLPVFTDAIIDMMIVIHRILASIISVLTQ